MISIRTNSRNAFSIMTLIIIIQLVPISNRLVSCDNVVVDLQQQKIRIHWVWSTTEPNVFDLRHRGVNKESGWYTAAQQMVYNGLSVYTSGTSGFIVTVTSVRWGISL